MAKNSEARPGGTWNGLKTNVAPHNLEPGSLTEAKDVTIRDASLVEQRTGLKGYTTQGVTTQNTDTTNTSKLYPALALNQKKYADTVSTGVETKFEDRVVATLKNSTTNLYILADEATVSEENTLNAVQRNHWGYPSMFANIGGLYAIDRNLIGMNMGDPRMVDGMFTTHLTPGQLLTTKETVSEYEYSTGTDGGTTQTYDLYSRPLGTPSMPYIETSVSSSTINTGLWAATNAINSWAYRAVWNINDKYGAPTPPAYCVTSVMPEVSGTTYVSGPDGSGDTTFTLTFASAHGLVVGQYIEIIESNDDLWEGTWTVASTPTTTTATVKIRTATTTAKTVVNYRVSVKTTVAMHRPKEQLWSGHLLETPFSYTHSTAIGEFGDYHTRVMWRIGRFELYRTKMSSGTIEVGSIHPGDEMFLVATTPADNGTAETGWTDSPTAGTLAYVDSKKDSELDKFLYTNPSQEGIAASQYMPPQARVLENYKGTMFWGNVAEPQVLEFQFLTTLASKILLSVTLDSYPTDESSPTLNFSFDPTVNEGTSGKLGFKVTSTGIPATDVENTARAFVRVINKSFFIPLKARYVSGFDDEPGKIEVTALDYSTSSLAMLSSQLRSLNMRSSLKVEQYTTGTTGAYVNKVYPSAEQSDWTSTLLNSIILNRKRQPNRIYWSKYQIPAAVPKTNYMDLPSNVEIVGLRTTSQGMYVITDNGLWMISGTVDPWDLREVDLTAKCWAQGSIQTLNDNLFILTTNGVQVYGNGQVVSLPVNDRILPIRSSVRRVSLFRDQILETTEPWISSTVDPFNMEYILFLPKVGDETKHHGLRYNMNTQTWTVIDRNFRCAIFNDKNDSNRMIYGDSDRAILLQERDNDDPLLYSDEDAVLSVFSGAVSGISDTELANVQPDVGVRYYGDLTIYSGLNDAITAGDFIVTFVYDDDDNLLYMKPNKILYYEAIIRNALPDFEIILEEEIHTPDANEEVKFVRGFNTRVGLSPFTAGDPAVLKRFTNMHIHLQGSVREITAEVHTEQRREPISVTIETPNPFDGWGQHAWGGAAWGNETNDAMPNLETIVPRSMNLDRALTVVLENNGFNQDLKLQRMSVDFDVISKRAK